MNYALILLNIWIARVTIRLTQAHVYSGDINSIKSGITRSTKRSKILGTNWFAQLWAVINYDFEKSQDFFTKCSKEQKSHRFYTRNI